MSKNIIILFVLFLLLGSGHSQEKKNARGSSSSIPDTRTTVPMAMIAPDPKDAANESRLILNPLLERRRRPLPRVKTTILSPAPSKLTSANAGVRLEESQPMETAAQVTAAADLTKSLYITRTKGLLKQKKITTKRKQKKKRKLLIKKKKKKRARAVWRRHFRKFWKWLTETKEDKKATRVGGKKISTKKDKKGSSKKNRRKRKKKRRRKRIKNRARKGNVS